MSFGRRAFLSSLPVAAASLSLGTSIARADTSIPASDPRLSPRFIGRPDAPIHVDEWFSLTCTHCGHFAETVFPEVKAKLIDTGKVCYRFHDFPLDQLALLGAMVARTLPADRYFAFTDDLLRTQMQWAFGRDVDPIEELKKHASLAGLSASEVDAINADETFRQAIVSRQDKDQSFLEISGTPYFRINNTPADSTIALSFDAFNAALAKAH
ncbi:thiol:disulfide interchange protein [Neokomagataea thailandica NBRC 106555]|uniref:Thiol:disulfide interchange protein n=2 Tax=Neokomagataea TaxID=1223423 RepID=A0A4Y6V733_9PROT|nr:MULTISPECIES: thioredoxin domain-containing protein [Neokomagataea]QDH24297.1 thiol:disulfide interchange protein [Neokomagataea tanensis]GBR53070.1 thiol:disulfide interchange protein [Neokomagataea thailandica NBRC 106555]